jgi:ABC-type glycerol-3-phosphate transport system permease component
MKRRTLWQRIIIYGAALLLAGFWFGPFVLVGLGSVIPEANLFSFPPNWFADPPFLGNYRYIFTGEIPQTYLQTGTTRSMVSQEIRWIPYSVFNSFIVALAVMFIVLVLGSLASYAYAR